MNEFGIAAAVVLGLSVPAATAAPAPASKPSVLALAIGQARTSGARQRVDRFAADAAATAYEGAPFSVTLRPIDGNTTGVAANSALWTYDRGELTFDLTPTQAPRRNYEFRKYELIYTSAVGRNGKPYVGANAFGATRRVTVEHWRREGIAVLSAPHGEEPASLSRRNAADVARGLPVYHYADLEKSYPLIIHASGPDARNAVATTVLVVEGTLTKLPDEAGVAICASSYNGPEVDAPIEINEAACWAGANITRVAYINRTTGAVLKEWKAAAP